MSRLADEIETLLENTSDGRSYSFEPVQAKRRQLRRRRYTWTAGTVLALAAVVGYQLQGAGTGHRSAPSTPAPTHVLPAPQTAAPTGGLPPLAGTVWHIDAIGSNPKAYTTTGPINTPDYLFAEIRFSTETTRSCRSVASPAVCTSARASALSRSPARNLPAGTSPTMSNRRRKRSARSAARS